MGVIVAGLFTRTRPVATEKTDHRNNLSIMIRMYMLLFFIFKSWQVYCLTLTEAFEQIKYDWDRSLTTKMIIIKS